MESIVGSQRLEITQKIEEKELVEAQLKEARERLDNFNNLNQSVDDSTGILQVLFHQLCVWVTVGGAKQNHQKAHSFYTTLLMWYL